MRRTPPLRTSMMFGALVAALLGCAGPAAAQVVFNSNVLFDNNVTGTLAGQFSGPPSAGPTCAAGLTPAALGTVTYTRNVYANPLLPNAIYQANVFPNFQPAPGSPAYTNTASLLPNDGFFEPTCYAGAIGPGAYRDWTYCKGTTDTWTYHDSTGASRQDLHLAGMPDPRPLAVYPNINLYTSQTGSADSHYLVRGPLRV